VSRARGLAELDDLEVVFQALAHHARRTILLVLLARGGEMTSGAIAARFEHSWPTTTRHLRVLQEAGLVSVGLRGRERTYRLDSERLLAVAGGWIARFAPAAGEAGW
jgi:DNA-binding transcriptional ArsR family regulator